MKGLIQMKKNQLWVMLLLLLVVVMVGNRELQAEDLVKPFAVDTDIYNFNITMDSFVIKPQNTNTKFQIDISYLPESKNLKNLPVIYVTDGQWRRMDHKYIHYLTYKKVIPPVIVAGIGYPEEYDAGQVRITDLLVEPDNFLKAIKKEMIPLVESRYGADPQKRIVFGASCGGHFAAYSFVKDSLDKDSIFWGYIGSSPYLKGAGAEVIELARELASKERVIKKYLYLAYGEKEGQEEYHSPNDTLYKILATKKLKDLHFYHYVYPGSDHFTNTRLTLIDGLRLLLGNKNGRGIGAKDLKYKTCRYDFKTTTQYYDWQTNLFAQNSHESNPKYSQGVNPGSFKVSADFSKYQSLRFETSSVYFPDLADRELEFNLYVPEDLTKLNYSLQFLIYSTFDAPWITDTSESFQLNKSGWNTFKYKWRGRPISGNINCIRGFGVMISQKASAPAWKGDLYFDEIKW
jgi:predicted alpha/beta superfamily hydrolase